MEDVVEQDGDESVEEDDSGCCDGVGGWGSTGLLVGISICLSEQASLASMNFPSLGSLQSGLIEYVKGITKT